MKRLFCIMIVTAGILLVGCSKAGGATEEENLNAVDNNDDIFPVITVSRPTVNQVYTSGDSIIVEGKVTDDKKLYTGKVQIKNDANGFVVADAYYETHFLSAINFRMAYRTYVTSPADLTVLLEFQDHGLNTTAATIKVKVNP